MSEFNDPFDGRTGKVTPDEIADALFITSKAVRARMRRLTAKDARPGSGGRWLVEIGSPFYVRLITDLQSPTRNRAVVVAELRNDV